MPHDASSRDTKTQVSNIFIGRKQELQKYETLLEKETPWVMLVAGLPGSGKSALLQHLKTETEKGSIPVAFVDFTQPRPRSDILTILEKLAEQVSPYCDGYPQSDQKSPSYLHFEEKLKDGRKRLLDVGKAINEIFIASGNATVDNVQMLIDSANAYKEHTHQVHEQMLHAFYDLIDTFRPDRLVIMFDASEALSQVGYEGVRHNLLQP